MKLFFRLLALTALGLSLAIPPARAQSNQSILLLDPGGHTSIVHQALFLPGGKELISVGEDKVIRVWNAETGKQISTIHAQIGTGQRDKLYAAALSKDGKTLAVAGSIYEGQLSTEHPERNRYFIRVFQLNDLHNPQTGVTMTLLPGDTGVKTHILPIETLAFSPVDSNLLASGGADYAVCVWNVKTGKPVWNIDAIPQNDFQEDVVSGLAWSPDGKQLASASLDKTIHIWDVAKARSIKSLNLGQPVHSLAWSADGATLAAGTESDFGGEVRLFSANGFQKIGGWKQDNSVSSLAFSPDSHSLVSGLEGYGDQFPVTLWSVPDGRKLGQFTQHNANVTSVAFSDDGHWIASAGGRSNDIYLWSQPDAKTVQHLAGTGGEASDVVWAEQPGKDGQPATYRLKWKSNGGSQTHVFDFGQMALLTGATADAAWQPPVTSLKDGPSLKLNEDRISLTVSSGGTKSLLPPPPDKGDADALSDVIVDNPKDPADHAYTLLADGKAAVIGSRYNLALYRLSDGTLVRKFEGHLGPINSVAVSPDGKYLASASSDQTVAIWPLPKSLFVAEDTVTRPLLQLYAGPGAQDSATDEFVVWNPEYGYFDASPGGQQLIGWQTNNGEDQMANYVTASNGGIRNRPDIIRLTLQTGSAEEALREAHRQDSNFVTDATALQDPPLISIDSPGDGDKVNQENTTVRVTVTPQKGNLVAYVQLTVNKHIIKTPFPSDGTAPSKYFRKDGDHWIGELPVRLKHGVPNTLTLTAQGADEWNSDPITRTVISSLPPELQGKPKLTLLAIGIAKYEQYDRLRYAAADAQEISQLFKEQEGDGSDKTFSHVDVKVLVDDDANQANIVAALKELASKNQETDDDDVTIVFISGHGFADGQNYYLLPVDVDGESTQTVIKKAINFNDITAAIQGRSGNVLFLLDTCHAGGENDGLSNVLKNIADRAYQGDPPIISFLACAPTESSWEDPTAQHGVFTRAILEGLRGAAKNHDNKVSAWELWNYIYDSVPKRISELKKLPQTSLTPVTPQTPQINAFISSKLLDNLFLSHVSVSTASNAAGTP